MPKYQQVLRKRVKKNFELFTRYIYRLDKESLIMGDQIICSFLCDLNTVVPLAFLCHRHSLVIYHLRKLRLESVCNSGTALLADFNGQRWWGFNLLWSFLGWYIIWPSFFDFINGLPKFLFVYIFRFSSVELWCDASRKRCSWLLVGVWLITLFFLVFLLIIIVTLNELLKELVIL